MNNTVIGQYIPTNSIIHRLDPRIKLFGMIVLIVAIFLVPISTTHYYYAFIAMGAMVLLPIILIIMAKIPILKVLRGLRPMMTLLIFTFVMQLFFVSTGDLLFQTTMYLSWSSIGVIVGILAIFMLIRKYVPVRILLLMAVVFLVFYVQTLLPYGPLFDYQFTIYSDGLIRSGLLVLRIVSVMMIASLLTFTTSTIELNDGIESLLKPLKLIGINPATWAMTMALTFRFIPTLLSETQKIMKAQTSRGMDFEESRFTQKVVQVVALLIPIFNISITRALDLADAMEVRGYVIGKKRTKIDEYKIRLIDILALILCLGVLGVAIYVRVTL